MNTKFRPSDLLPAGFIAERITHIDDETCILLSRARATASCPVCGRMLRTVRSRYCRQVADLPLSGRRSDFSSAPPQNQYSAPVDSLQPFSFRIFAYEHSLAVKGRLTNGKYSHYDRTLHSAAGLEKLNGLDAIKCFRFYCSEIKLGLEGLPAWSYAFVDTTLFSETEHGNRRPRLAMLLKTKAIFPAHVFSDGYSLSGSREFYRSEFCPCECCLWRFRDLRRRVCFPKLHCGPIGDCLISLGE